MILVPMYGRRAMVIHDGRQSYHTENGVLRVPEHLVARALDAGFSRQPFADIAIPDDQPALDPDDAIVAAPLVAPRVDVGAVAMSDLPPEHPQTAETARHAAASHASGVAAGTAAEELDELAAAEERLRNAR